MQVRRYLLAERDPHRRWRLWILIQGASRGAQFILQTMAGGFKG